MSYFKAMQDEYEYTDLREEELPDYHERMLDEAAVYGLLDHDSPDYETEGDQCRHIIGLFRAAGMEDLAEYWRGNCASVGLL